MTGVLITAHGSRKPETFDTMDKIAEMVMGMLPDAKIECAYMEFSDKDLNYGFDKFRDAGITSVVVVPYFLFSGIHIHEDIPQMIAEYKEKHPEMDIRMGETLGTDKRLAEVLADRVRQAL